MNWMETMYRSMTPADRIALYTESLPQPGFFHTAGQKAALPILEKLIREDGNWPTICTESDCC